jgi:5,6-dimethylbenzimidazole synthase
MSTPAPDTAPTTGAGRGTGPGDSASPPPVGLYETIHRRRDVRGEFTAGPVDPVILERILTAAHAAPSVGLTQPWDFVLITARDPRISFRRHVEEERARFYEMLPADQARRFLDIKIEGILESSLSIVVTHDRTRGAPAILGGHAIADTGLYSTSLAIQNLWLAATAEGWGVGWVSFYRESFLASLLNLPDHVRPVAWLCVGPVSHHQEVPDLERLGWRQRRPLQEAIHHNTW